ncbi:MAG: PQQ-like beta-propeller repeat protein [archaeon]|nr:MAG: PQQ-like beta-propeller repeat protein [archaeon]
MEILTPRIGRSSSLRLALTALFAVMLSSPLAYATTAPTSIAPVWTVFKGGPHSDVGWGVATDDSGSSYFVGSTTVPGPLADIFVSKVGPNGASIWNASFDGGGDDAAYQVVWRAGMLYVGGRSFVSTDHELNMLVQAYNASTGELAWSTTWEVSPGAGYNEVDGIVLEGDDLYAAGWAAVPGHSEDLGLLKLDAPTGHVVWNSTWGTSGWDEANGDIVFDSAHVYVAGRYNSPNLLYGGRALIASFNKSDGAYVKNATWWEGSGEADFLGMTGDSTSLYPVGISATTGDRIVLQKYDHDLKLAWSSYWEGSKSESSRMVRLTANGTGLVVAGQTSSFGNGATDALLLGYDLGGNLRWSRTWGGIGNDQPQGLAIAGGLAFVSGQTTSFGAGSQDAFLAKFTLPDQGSSTTSTTSSIHSVTTSYGSSSTTSTGTSSSKGGVPEFSPGSYLPLLIAALVTISYLFARAPARKRRNQTVT